MHFTYYYISISVEDQFIHLNKNRLVYFWGDVNVRVSILVKRKENHLRMSITD